MKKYDYLIVGAGLYGAVFANEAGKAGARCLVVEKRSHTGGNLYCSKNGGIDVHEYGPHIFHTDNRALWDYANGLTPFKSFMFSPVAMYKGKKYSLPFNMNTFRQIWGITEPAEAKAIIDRQRRESGISQPRNLEEQAICLVGRDIYETLIRGYTEKQWGRKATELPPSIINRLPVRFTYDDSYYNDRWVGIPENGYNAMFDKLLAGAEIRLDTDYLEDRDRLSALADKTLFTGMLDAFYGCRFGTLNYRSLRFEKELLDLEDFQGSAVVNYTDSETPFTRIIEHKHFLAGKQKNTIITREYPAEWSPGREAYYPVNDSENCQLYGKYRALADLEGNFLFGGRLADYEYRDMDKTIECALAAAHREFRAPGQNRRQG